MPQSLIKRMLYFCLSVSLISWSSECFLQMSSASGTWLQWMHSPPSPNCFLLSQGQGRKLGVLVFGKLRSCFWWHCSGRKLWCTGLNFLWLGTTGLPDTGPVPKRTKMNFRQFFFQNWEKSIPSYCKWQLNAHVDHVNNVSPPEWRAGMLQANRRPVSSVGRPPISWAGGDRFESRQDQHSGSLNNWEESAAFVMTSTNG